VTVVAVLVAGAPGGPIAGWNLATEVTAAISLAGGLLVLAARPRVRR
jgi:hypothetical protein